MFAALAVPQMILSPVSGWFVDRVGSKLVAVIGFITLCPALFLLAIPTGPATLGQISSLVAVLMFNGYISRLSAADSSCATAMIEAPEMTEIVLQFRKDARCLQGNGYAQAYGWFEVAYSSGTLFGPLIASWIVQTWGWTTLCFVMGTASGLTIIPVILFMGGSRKVDT